MRVTPIKNLFAGERIVAVSPTMAPQVDAAWRRRMNLYTGRTLSDTALEAEQGGRAGRLATIGQTLSPGIATGLEIDLEERDDGFFLHIAPGIGLMHSGEDVVIPRALRIDVAHLRVPPGTSGADPDSIDPPVPAATQLGVLVLQPSLVRRAERLDPNDPCDVDETDDAFADEQTVDAARLLLVPWDDDWTALPAFGPAWRNRIAHTIFELERLQGPDDLHPWEMVGVPIGLLGFQAGAPLFVDRFSVARAGGKARPRTPLVSSHPSLRAGTPFLWQARIQQFAEELAAMPRMSGTSLNDHISAFVALPPAGMLPREAVTFDPLGRAENHFFPVTWRLKAAPLPLEQLDEVVNRCAGLAPLFTDGAEDVLVIAPVPQKLYEPKLLLEELVDPIFTQTLTWFVFERDNLRLRRAVLRRDHALLVGASEGAVSVPSYPDPDPKALEEEPALPSPLPETLGAYLPPVPEIERPPEIPAPADPFVPEERYGVTGGAAQTVTAVVELRATIVADGVFSPDEIADFDTDMGLAAFIAKIEGKLQRADDTIDFSFLKSHANIYRLRQFMLGNIAATRLATSPVLTTIAKGASAAAVTDEVNKFFFNVKGRLPRGTTYEPPPPQGDGQQLSFMMLKSQPASLAAEETQPLFAGKISFSTVLKEIALGGRTFTSDSDYPTADLVSSTSLLGSGGFRLDLDATRLQPIVALPPPPTGRDVVQQAGAIAGEGAYDFRTVSVAQRIDESPGRDSKNFAVAARAEALEAINLLREEKMNLDDIPVFGLSRLSTSGQPLFQRRFLKAVIPTPPATFDPDADLSAADDQFERDTDSESDAAGNRNIPNPRFGMIKRRSSAIGFKAVTLLPHGGLGRALKDPVGQDADEGNLYSDAVLVLEHAVATLRAVEGRIAAYRGQLVKCRAALAVIDGNKTSAAKRLAVVDAELEEKRHMVATARALLADESTRVAQINQRRSTVIAEHVQFLAFVRPRHTEALVDAPRLELNPGLFEAPVPACLAAHQDAPTEIDEMMQLLREAPVVWFTNVPKILEKLDRVELIHGTLAFAKARAQIVRTTQLQPVTFVNRAVTGKFAQAIQKVTVSQQRSLGDIRINTARLDLARFSGLGWQESREQAKHVLSLGDLIEANHGRSFVADEAARELAQIGKIAACLHTEASDVLPAIRLEWAERLSEYEDTTVSLRSLAVLPRWGEVPYVDRKEIELLADWLYGRVDPRRADAVAWMDDLVRVCLLLASHAPVDEILAGAVIEDTPAPPGKMVPVAIDPSKVRLGMKVMFFKGQDMVAHGIVEDLVGNQARARIAEAATQTVLTRGTSARFVDPLARTAPSFFRAR